LKGVSRNLFEFFHSQSKSSIEPDIAVMLYKVPSPLWHGPCREKLIPKAYSGSIVDLSDYQTTTVKVKYLSAK
jgi:hypothetical protein